MKAAILMEQKRPLVIDEVELPPTLHYGQVLVRVVCSGICGSQLGEVEGVKGPDRFLPHLLGHEGGGIVEKIGAGVSGMKPDDHVVMHWRKGKGIEAAPPVYRLGNTTVNAGWVTTFNEYAIVAENRLTVVPKEIDFETLALLGCAVTTGLGIINNDAQLKMGESIAIFGIGSVGLNVVNGAALVSAYPIIAIDLYDHKLALAKQFGATHLINSLKDEVRNAVFDIVGAGGVDVVIDHTGHPRIIELAYELTAARGKTILVGVPALAHKASIYTLPLHFEKKFFGSHGGNSQPSVDIPNYVKLIHAAKLKPQAMVTHRYHLAEINRAFDEIKAGQVGKAMIHLTA